MSALAIALVLLSALFHGDFRFSGTSINIYVSSCNCYEYYYYGMSPKFDTGKGIGCPAHSPQERDRFQI